MLAIGIMVGCESKEDNTAILTPSQAKAMSQINNAKGKHDSKNGQSSASVGSQSTKTGGMTCYTFNYDDTFNSSGADDTSIVLKQLIYQVLKLILWSILIRATLLTVSERLMALKKIWFFTWGMTTKHFYRLLILGFTKMIIT